mmetsp:Transcript_31202/g.99661  ORF Transcript_31202/g.99661 Transcript_31202/m.99661 type:complete len:904 (-) Transcript_31202:117-2828(-)
MALQRRRHSLIDVATRLGIDLDRDPDLWWISERALLTEPEIGLTAASRRAVVNRSPTSGVTTAVSSYLVPPPVKHAIACYSTIAREAGVGWPVRAADAGQRVGGGWWRGVARSDFEAMAQGELSFALGDILLVQQEDPTTGCSLADGWCMALLESAPDRFGLVPRDFVRLHDVAVTAAAPYRAVSSGELSFEIGDEIIIRPGALPGQSWWMGSLNGRRGYFPRHVLDAEWAPFAGQHAGRIQRRYRRWLRKVVRGRASAAKLLGESILKCQESEGVNDPAHEEQSDANAPPDAAAGPLTAESAGTTAAASTAEVEAHVRDEKEALELETSSHARAIVAAVMSAALAHAALEQCPPPGIETAPPVGKQPVEMQAAPLGDWQEGGWREGDWREKVQADLAEVQASLRAREETHAARVQAELASLQAALQARFSAQEEAHTAHLQAVMSRMQACIPLGPAPIAPAPLSRDPSVDDATVAPPSLHPASELAEPPSPSVSNRSPSRDSHCCGPLDSASATLFVAGGFGAAIPAPVPVPSSTAGSLVDSTPSTATASVSNIGAGLPVGLKSWHVRSSLETWDSAAHHLPQRSPVAEPSRGTSAPTLQPVTAGGRRKSARRTKTPTRNADLSRMLARASTGSFTRSSAAIDSGPAKSRAASAQRPGRPDGSFEGVGGATRVSSTRAASDAQAERARTDSARAGRSAKHSAHPGSSQRPSQPSSAQRVSRTLSSTPLIPQLGAYRSHHAPAASVSVGRLSSTAPITSLADIKASTASVGRPSAPSKQRVPPAPRGAPKAPRPELMDAPARRRDRAGMPPPSLGRGHAIPPRDPDLLWANPSDQQAIRELLQAANNAVGVHRAAEMIRSQHAYTHSTSGARAGAKPRPYLPGECIRGQQPSKPRRTYDRFYS